MKKGIRILIMLLLAALLAGCGAQKEDDAVVLGEYKGIEIESTKPEVTKEDLDMQVQYIMSMYPMLEPVTDRDTVEDGDTVNIDYEGKKDGVAFEGGTAQGYDLTIGSATFIEGFEEGLIGVKKGETVDLNLTFPEDYPSEDLAGAEVVFTVTVNEIQLAKSTLDDAYVEYLGIENVSTVEEYRQLIREDMQLQLDISYEYDLQMQILSKVMENSTVAEPAEEMVQKYTDQNIAQIESQAAYYGVDLETFVSAYMGLDMETFQAEAEAGALETARQVMVCLKIAGQEGMEVTDQEVDEQVEEIYASWGFTSADEFKQANDMDDFRESLLLTKVLEFLVDNAVITEGSGETVTQSEISTESETQAGQ